MHDDRYAEEQDRAARRADEGWSFTGPSATLSLRPWREPSTISSLTTPDTAERVAERAGAPEPSPAQVPVRPSPAVAQVLESFTAHDEPEWMFPAEDVPAPVAVTPEPLAPPVASGWRPPVVPGGRPVRRGTPPSSGSGSKARGQLGGLLFAGLLFAGPPVIGLGMDAYREVVPPTVAVEAAQPAEDGSLEVSRDFGTFTVPAGWSEQYTDDMQQATLLRDEDPSAALVVNQLDRVDTSIEQACQEILGTGQEVRKLADVPVIGGVAGVAYRMQDGNGYTATAHCAAKDDGMIAITGSTVDTPQKSIDAAMRRIASSLH